MKHQWIAVGSVLLSLGFGLKTDTAIAQNTAQEANSILRTSLCTQNWSAAMQAADYCLDQPIDTTATTSTPVALEDSEDSVAAPASQPTTYEETNQYRKVTIHLDSPETVVTLGMTDIQSNTARQPFSTFVQQHNAAIVASGTYAVGTNWPLRSAGRFVGGTEQFARFSTGTVLGLKPGNIPEMTTIKTEGTPNWDDYEFALTSGPRLLKDGEVIPWQPIEEGFTDPKVTNTEVALGRTVIGFSEDGTKLYYVSFKQNVSLRQAAQVMKDMGCTDAMNLDGGATQALAHSGEIIVNSSRTQTHALVVFDVEHPAPNSLE